MTDATTEVSSGSFSWQTDVPPSLGGGNTAPSPTAYFLGALAGCAATFVRNTLAPQFGVRVDAVTAVTRCHADSRGLLGIDGATPALTDLDLEVRIESPESDERLQPIYAAWRERCPIYLAIARANPVHVHFDKVSACSSPGADGLHKEVADERPADHRGGTEESRGLGSLGDDPSGADNDGRLRGRHEPDTVGNKPQA